MAQLPLEALFEDSDLLSVVIAYLDVNALLRLLCAKRHNREVRCAFQMRLTDIQRCVFCRRDGHLNDMHRLTTRAMHFVALDVQGLATFDAIRAELKSIRVEDGEACHVLQVLRRTARFIAGCIILRDALH